MVCWRQRASYLLVTAGVMEGPVQSEGSRSSEQRNWEAGSVKERGNLTERDDLTSGTEKIFPAGDDGVLVNLLVGSQRWHQ